MTARLARTAFAAAPAVLTPRRAALLPRAPRSCRVATVARRTRPAQMRMAGGADDMPHGTHSPWAGDAPDVKHASPLTDAAPRMEGAAPPPSTPAGGGYDGGRDDADHADLLRQFGRAGETLPADVAALPTAQLEQYLNATRNGFTRWLASIWPGWRRRVAADPDFPFKVLMEETVGLGLAASGMIAARGKDILKELDFAICDIAVGGTLNFILVYLLTPAIAGGGGGSVGGVGQLMKYMDKLPANMFSAGPFSLGQRATGFFLKGALFSVCGFGGSMVGTALSQVLVAVRRAVSPKGTEVAEKELPNIFANSAAWAGFMFVSSNPRYQGVAGMERVLFNFAPEAVAKLGSGALRTANNVLGGANWVWWARAIGLQAKAGEKAEGEEQ